MATVETTKQGPAPESPEGRPRRLSLAEYDELIREGRFGKDDRYELLDGLLVQKMSKGLRHVAVTHRIDRTLVRQLPLDWHPRLEAPVELPVGPVENAPSRPEPDISVLRGPEGAFDRAYPGPEDIALAIEIASDARRLREDRLGLTRYAFNGVRCVWIVNLAANAIEVYTKPVKLDDDAVYQSIDIKRPGDAITVPLDGVADIVLDVATLLA